MKLKKVEEKDIDNIILYEKKYFNDTLGKDYIKMQLNNPYAYYVLILDDSSNFRGYLGATLETEGEIQNFFIVEGFRKKGYGHFLLKNLIEEAKRRNVKTIYLEVAINNLNAISLYESFDFKKSHIRKGYYNGLDAQVMIKEMF